MGLSLAYGILLPESQRFLRRGILMKVPAQRPKQPASSNLTRASIKPAASYTIHPPSPSQCSTGNHADQQILDANTERVEARPDHSAAARFTYDFSGVPVFSK